MNQSTPHSKGWLIPDRRWALSTRQSDPQSSLLTGAIRPTLLCGVVLLMVGLCGCSNSSQMVSADPFLQDPQSRQGTQFARTKTPASSPANQSAATGRIQQAGFEQSSEQSEQPAILRLKGSQTELPQQLRNARAADETIAAAVQFTPAEARQPLEGVAPQVAEWPPKPGFPPASPELHPDEYLFDGGDRGLPVHYGRHDRFGLDTEDTIAEYADHEGGRHMKPTNRVAIYAPRFGAVRTVSSLQSNVSVDKLAGAHHMTHGVGLRNQLAPSHHLQQEGPEGIRMRSRASGLDAETGQRDVKQSTRLAGHTKLLNTFQDLAFIRTGAFEKADKPRLAYGVQAASVWTRDQNPVITASTAGAQEVYRSDFKPAEIVGLEDKRTKGHLRIVKMADKKSARPGEIVTFTIRYDNVGDRELHDIRIVDNLTPRLEYIEESATSDRPGEIIIEDNEEGSVVLQFEFDEPLPGKTGGVITFQTKVR